MQTFNSAIESHVSSSGFVNFMPGGLNAVQRTLDTVFQQFPKAIIVDGTDDWGAPKENRPETFPNDYGITALAYFHTGVSGISKSGIVISVEDFKKLPKTIQKNPRLRIYLGKTRI